VKEMEIANKITIATLNISNTYKNTTQ